MLMATRFGGPDPYRSLCQSYDNVYDQFVCPYTARGFKLDRPTWEQMCGNLGGTCEEGFVW